jgi:hypothetical protein
MYREDLQEDLIDLGTATEATKGVAIGLFDAEATLRPAFGLSED